MSVRALLASALLAAGSMAQLTGSVGPLTTSAQKAAVKVCNILDYGGVASVDTDNGAAITAAWSACASGGQVYIPAGDYGLATWVSLKHGTGVSINIEGTIHRTGTGGGNMIFIQLSTDLEIYSATSTGAIQALGYEFHKNGEYGARILRLYKTSNFSIHDIALVDSPQFHLTLDTCTSGEVYNTVIHGGYEGGLDGIDVSGSNIWIHDVEVSNKDECVTVKNPSSNLLIESIHCNWSGGCGMGSLSTGTNIHDIEYRNIYTHHSNNMYMIKSNGGDGTVYNLALNNFIGHTNAYTLLMDTAWSKQAVGSGNGVVYHDISVNEWHGTAQNGVQRAPVRLLCPALAPCYDVNITNFSVSSEAASKELYICQNAYGEGACLKELEAGATSATASYAAITQTLTVASTAIATMANELASGFDISSPIPIPTIPASFFPGIAPKSAILSAAAVHAAVVKTTSTSAIPTATPAASSSTTSAVDTLVATVVATVAATTSAASTTTATPVAPVFPFAPMGSLRPSAFGSWSGRWNTGFKGKKAE